jgi:triacylglycerol lipase
MHPPIENFYDRVTAAALARAAAAAYEDAGGMAAWAAGPGCSCAPARDERTDTLAFVAANDQSVFVVFRGTRDLRNWVTDLDCRRVRWMVDGMGLVDGMDGVDLVDGAEVHEGFWRALEGVWEQVAGLIARMAEGRREIFFCGHSLGGALAMLAAARWQARSGAGNSAADCGSLPRAATLYTFGQPRVGNAAWARRFDQVLGGRSFRVVHSDDVVARVPWLLGFYRHAGHEVFYDALGRAHQDWPWWRKAPSDAVGLWAEWRRGKVALLGDHRVATYVELLEAEGGTKSGFRLSNTVFRRSGTILRRS